VNEAQYLCLTDHTKRLLEFTDESGLREYCSVKVEGTDFSRCSE